MKCRTDNNKDASNDNVGNAVDVENDNGCNMVSCVVVTSVRPVLLLLLGSVMILGMENVVRPNTLLLLLLVVVVVVVV